MCLRKRRRMPWKRPDKTLTNGQLLTTLAFKTTWILKANGDLLPYRPRIQHPTETKKGEQFPHQLAGWFPILFSLLSFSFLPFLIWLFAQRRLVLSHVETFSWSSSITYFSFVSPCISCSPCCLLYIRSTDHLSLVLSVRLHVEYASALFLVANTQP